MRTDTRTTTAFAGEAITVSNTAIGGTAATYAPVVSGTLQPNGPPASKAYVTVETQPIRIRWDGTSPTDTVGHLLSPGQSFEIIGVKNVAQLRMIRQTATDSSVHVSYER